MVMSGFAWDNETSESETEDGDSLFVTKRNLDEAIALVYEEDTSQARDRHFGGTKALKECRSSCLKALNLQSAADIFTPENATTEILEELRTSLLENNFSNAAKLLQILLEIDSKSLLPVIWKTAVVLFCNHQSNSEGYLEEFLEMCVDQRLPEDKKRLIKILVTLQDPLQSKSGSKTNSNKDVSTIDSSENEDNLFC